MFDIIDEFCNYDKSAKIPDYNYNTLTLHNEYDDSLIEYDILLNFSEDLKSNITLSKVNTRILSFISSKQYIKNILDSYYSIRELEEQFIRDVNRSKLYINGIQQTLSGSTFPSSAIGFNNSGSKFNIGKSDRYANFDFDGTMSHYHFIDGTAYAPTTFAESDSVSGIWKPKTAPSVTYGTNGFFLKFENSGNMDLDSSGNNLTFTTGGTLTQNVDTPSNNFATFNPLFDAYSSSISFNNGNLRLDQDASGWGTAVSSLAANTGKWYAEFKATSITSNGMLVGIVEDGYANNLHYVGVAGTIGYHYNGEIYNRDSNTSFGNSYAQGDIIGVAMDLTNGYVYFSKNGTYQNSGDPTSGATGTGGISIGGTTGSIYFLGQSINASGYHGEANFGQGYFGTTAVASAGTAPSEGGIFEYDCPSGYQALCTKGINSF